MAGQASLPPVPPSRSAAQLHGRRNCAPVGDTQQLSTMETDLSLGPAPAVADAASATIMRRAGELLRVLAKHLFDGSDPGRETEALNEAVHILPSRLEAGHRRGR